MDDRIFKELSYTAYLLDTGHDNYDPDLKQGAIRPINENKFIILKTEDNTDNGMQAMAVAPVKNDRVDKSEIVIAYAGTNMLRKIG
ncbi:hypothetical protein [Paraliobacillus sp. JSM ZJ581]|uniref:hypothetical protein n=1 Tax=Paraliobacillus sp. JSM ZJ581 TaxID=3342118 RepID=UPI0035A8342F